MGGARNSARDNERNSGHDGGLNGGRKGAHIKVLWLAALIAAASFALCVYLTVTSIIHAFYSPATRLWELLAGGMLAWAQQHRAQLLPARPPLPQRPPLLSSLGLLLIALAVFTLDGAAAFPGWAALLPVVGSVLVIAAGPDAWLNRRVLAAPPLVWLGLISYPLYLWHWPLLVFAGRIPALPMGDATRAGAVLLGVLLAWLTYRLIERPVREGAKRAGAFSSPVSSPTASAVSSLVLPLAGAMALLLGAGAITYASVGFPQRPASLALRDVQRWADAQAWTDADMATPACRALYGGTDYCMLTPGATPTIALIGDSFSNALYYGLRERYRARGQTLVQLGNGNCPPLLDVHSNFVHWDGSRCANTSNPYLRRIAQDARITTVILAGNWHIYLNGRRMRQPTAQTPPWQLTLPDAPTLTSNEAVFSAAFERTVQMFEAAGKRLIFIHQTPELDFKLDDCAPFRHPQLEACRTPRAKEEAYLNEYKAQVDPLLRKHPRILVLDPLELFCDAQYCHYSREGLVLYRDNVHVSRIGSAYVGSKLALPE